MTATIIGAATLTYLLIIFGASRAEWVIAGIVAICVYAMILWGMSAPADKVDTDPQGDQP